MSKERHTPTPGPWTVVEFDGVYDVCSEAVPGSVCSLFDEADAHLIAAAPDLYSELYMQVRNCPVCKGDGFAIDVFDMLTKEPPHEKTPCTRCAGSRAALAKAETRSTLPST